MASTWLQQADSFINPENSKEIQTAGQAAVAAALQQSMLSIEKVVQGLGLYLTSEDNSVRARGKDCAEGVGTCLSRTNFDIGLRPIMLDSVLTEPLACNT